MTFLKKITAKYRVLCGALGYITKKQLQEKVPELGKSYEQAYAGKEQLKSKSRRPDIQIISSDSFHFPLEKYESGSWHLIYAYLEGKVVELPVAQYYGKVQKLVPGSMILDCMRGHLNICHLYVHPDDATPLLKEGEKELSDNEYLVLSVMQGLKSFAREDEFYRIKYRHDDYEKKKENPNEYKDTLKLLAEKGLVQISSSGAAKLTLEGKNRALQAKDVMKKYRGY